MASIVNPLRQVHDLLWEILEQHSGWTDLVRFKNRVNYLERPFPKPEETSSGDLPEVGIVPFGARPKLPGSSSSMMLIKLFSIVVATGESSIGRLLDIEFETYKALAGFQARLPLTWKGHPFCTHMMIAEVTDATLDDRGVTGWSSVLGCEVHMNFPLVTLRED